MEVVDWQGWVPTEKAVLLFLKEEGNLLLIHKKRGLGAGKVTAPGGRVEAAETWEAAALRETREETGLTPLHLQNRGHLCFQFTSGYALECRVFLAQGWRGELTPCDEADPFWCPEGALPWEAMWSDDFLWLRPLLAGGTVSGRFLFDGEVMKDAHVEVQRRSEPTLRRLTTETFGL